MKYQCGITSWYFIFASCQAYMVKANSLGLLRGEGERQLYEEHPANVNINFILELIKGAGISPTVKLPGGGGYSAVHKVILPFCLCKIFDTSR